MRAKVDELLLYVTKNTKLRNQKDIATFFGIKEPSVTNWKKDGDIPSDRLYALEEECGVSLRQFIIEDQEVHQSPISSIIKAPIISAKASAGVGIAHYDVESVGELLIDRMMFKILPNLQNVRAIEVSGDSMYPTLKDGDYVVIEENVHFSGEGIYVLQFDGMLLVKRLQATSRGLKVLSDNVYYKDDEYAPDDDQRTFQVVGKVVLRIQR